MVLICERSITDVLTPDLFSAEILCIFLLVADFYTLLTYQISNKSPSLRKALSKLMFHYLFSLISRPRSKPRKNMRVQFSC